MAPAAVAAVAAVAAAAAVRCGAPRGSTRCGIDGSGSSGGCSGRNLPAPPAACAQQQQQRRLRRAQHNSRPS
ncbi:hypothetical protein JKP88DRAFT_276724 [Tribonema minus]|uniref:Secreted protein n=1 Tax=Tribonema minus TaxID=303371 RepID=A0A835Z1G8_9STRA|nr:hypothetical protein JKP88DRAFT_276724 [Tribonema minus]